MGMRKQAVLSLLFVLFVFVGFGYSFIPLIDFYALIGDGTTQIANLGEYPLYFKITNPSLGGSEITNACFTVAGCDKNNVDILVNKESSNFEIFPNVGDKISLIKSFGGLIYVDIKKFTSSESKKVSLLVSAKNYTEKKPIPSDISKTMVKQSVDVLKNNFFPLTFASKPELLCGHSAKSVEINNTLDSLDNIKSLLTLFPDMDIGTYNYQYDLPNYFFYLADDQLKIIDEDTFTYDEIKKILKNYYYPTEIKFLDGAKKIELTPLELNCTYFTGGIKIDLN